MRTTIIIDKSLVPKIKPFLLKRGLSRFVNKCICEYLEAKGRSQADYELELSYERASQSLDNISKDFEAVETEEWPE